MDDAHGYLSLATGMCYLGNSPDTSPHELAEATRYLTVAASKNAIPAFLLLAEILLRDHTPASAAKATLQLENVARQMDAQDAPAVHQAMADAARQAHILLLAAGEQRFSNKSQGITYLMLRQDPVKPDCNPDTRPADPACAQQWASYRRIVPHITPELRRLRELDATFVKRWAYAPPLEHP